MSRDWAGGSTTRWRATRLAVLNRDGWVCQLCGRPIDPNIKHPDPMSAQVHHTRGKAWGDDPRYLQAAHRDCNLRARVAPQPKRVTKW